MARAGLILFAALPFVAWLASASHLAGRDVLGPWFSLLCHREPARTLTLLGETFPVCARCTGIYAGLLLGAVAPSPGVPSRFFVIAVAVGAGLMLLDVSTEAMGLRFPSLATRFATGVALAWPAAWGALLADTRRS